jgi:hypothetical protein
VPSDPETWPPAKNTPRAAGTMYTYIGDICGKVEATGEIIAIGNV